MSWAAIPRFKHWTPVVYTSLDAEADIFQGKLAAEGIPAVVFPRCAYPSAYGLYYLNEYAVLVPRAQYEKARALLNLEELPEGLDRKDLLSPASDYWFIANLRVLFWPVTLLRMLWARLRRAGEVSADKRDQD